MKKLFFIALSCFLSACSLYHVSSEDSTDNYYPSKQSPQEIVFLEAVNKPHEVIGVVTVNAERRQALNEILAKMKREAAILGGDAITDIRTDASGEWKNLPAQKLIGNAHVRANYSANVIVFK